MPENEGATTFDDFSMESSSKAFLNALQELKNLRPQLYSAADYCEKSYLHHEEKQMVLDNLKDYTLQALVNAVDHLGTVAYKFNHLLQHQAFDVSTTELRISCLDQQLVACQMYTDQCCLRQQQLFLTTVPRYHKHYILPSIKSGNREVQSQDALKRIDNSIVRVKHARAKLRPHPSGTPASRTLYWHLASEAESERNASPNSTPSPDVEDSSCSGTGSSSKLFHLKAGCGSTGASPGPNPKAWCTTTKDLVVGSKQNLAFRLLKEPDWRETWDGEPLGSSSCKSKTSSVLSTFFVKNKFAKQNS